MKEKDTRLQLIEERYQEVLDKQIELQQKCIIDNDRLEFLAQKIDLCNNNYANVDRDLMETKTT
eukprot:CAMPEP_0170541114 /NCGR_PEP_ID=MMETSP0211-20121228/942_1 /TAXON_ID=311385 /ORGANISM="Pseudokeronopsis sp., Strain OXSARD2" /LENGTH=63 /DNA_ID=CAMNT_0010843733 /DNA_START=557 /DNA_END=748 /DNA_ORIENTATION=+